MLNAGKHLASASEGTFLTGTSKMLHHVQHDVLFYKQPQLYQPGAVDARLSEACG
jgi:hypothetical protein